MVLSEDWFTDFLYSTPKDTKGSQMKKLKVWTTAKAGFAVVQLFSKWIFSIGFRQLFSTKKKLSANTCKVLGVYYPTSGNLVAQCVHSSKITFLTGKQILPSTTHSWTEWWFGRRYMIHHRHNRIIITSKCTRRWTFMCDCDDDVSCTLSIIMTSIFNLLWL